jgi:sugar lactone lactonase YvrE
MAGSSLTGPAPKVRQQPPLQESNVHRCLSALVLLLLGLLAGLSGLHPSAPSGPTGPPLRRIVASVSYPEGPCCLAGKVYYVEYGRHRVNVWDGVRSRTIWELPGSGPAALLPLNGRELLLTCYDNNTLVRLSREGKTLETIRLDDQAQGPNDLVRDGRGGIWFSTSGTFAQRADVRGRVYYLPPGGKPRPVAENIYYANGLALTHGGRYLLVAEHLRGRILRFTVRDDGGLEDRIVWKHLADIDAKPYRAWFLGPDGLKVDSGGHVYLCHFGASQILVLRSSGDLERVITLPDRYVTNLAFSPNEELLYVTAVRNAWAFPYLGSVYEIPNDRSSPLKPG